jgi:hypothetical protein
VLGHREIDPEDWRDLDQRMVDGRIGDVADDRAAGIEGLGSRVTGLAGCRGCWFDVLKHLVTDDIRRLKNSACIAYNAMK